VQGLRRLENDARQTRRPTTVGQLTTGRRIASTVIAASLALAIAAPANAETTTVAEVTG